MRRSIIYIVICLLAALVPLLPVRSKPASAASGLAFPGWPQQFEGATLQPLVLSEREQRFSGGFPGRIGRFSDGRREIIIRWVTEATRKLHPASDCFEATGFKMQPLPIYVDERGLLWSSFVATRGNERLRVYERIYTDSPDSSAVHGQSWPDVSSWYWAAVREQSVGPWWAVTVAEREK